MTVVVKNLRNKIVGFEVRVRIDGCRLLLRHRTTCIKRPDHQDALATYGSKAGPPSDAKSNAQRSSK